MNTAATTTEQPIPLVLRLLDHQVVGDAREMLGNVDDLELRERDGQLLVWALMSGPPALAGRQGGRGGRWLHGVWRRLHPDVEPRPLAVPMEHVVQLGSAVEVGEVAEQVMTQAQGFERWLRAHVVGRLPGALGGDNTPADDKGPPRDTDEFVTGRDSRRISDLLGATVRVGTREIGRVMEVTAEVVDPRPERLGLLRLRDIVCSPHHLGEELGYTMARQGPLALGWLLRAWHRGDLLVSLDDVVGIDWDRREIEVGAQARLRHPHDPRPADQ